MAQVKWKYRVEGSTVLEVIVAMVVILVVLGLGLTIYSNVMRQSTPARQIRARMIIKKAMLSAHPPDGETEERSYGNWKARCEYKPYGSSNKLSEIQVTVIDESGNQVALSRQVIINKAGR